MDTSSTNPVPPNSPAGFPPSTGIEAFLIAASEANPTPAPPKNEPALADDPVAAELAALQEQEPARAAPPKAPHRAARAPARPAPRKAAKAKGARKPAVKASRRAPAKAARKLTPVKKAVQKRPVKAAKKKVARLAKAKSPRKLKRGVRTSRKGAKRGKRR